MRRAPRRAAARRGSGALRIIAGSLRGRRLASAPAGVRPTSDRVRESLFARLGDLSGERVLDLYAGTGALGIEALSRGAESLVAVDRAGAAVAAVRRNVKALGVGDQVRVIHREARGAIRQLARESACFDLILLDPPYADAPELDDVLEAIVSGGLLDPDGVVVVECAKRHAVSPVPGLGVADTRAYGDTSITWLAPEPGAQPDGGTSQR